MSSNSEIDLKSISILELEKVLLEATKRLDVEIFEEFYIHTEDYKHSKRVYLLRDLATAFNKFKELGDSYLESNIGVCNRCNKGCHGHQLVGNESKNYMNLLFENDVDKIIGITECADLITSIEIVDHKKRIYLHKHNDPSAPDYVPF
jgi:hypothetical protein